MKIIKLSNNNYLVDQKLNIGQQFKGQVITNIIKDNFYGYYNIILCNINYVL
jgi:hypothetical protein